MAETELAMLQSGMLAGSQLLEQVVDNFYDNAVANGNATPEMVREAKSLCRQRFSQWQRGEALASH